MSLALSVSRSRSSVCSSTLSSWLRAPRLRAASAGSIASCRNPMVAVPIAVPSTHGAPGADSSPTAVTAASHVVAAHHHAVRLVQRTLLLHVCAP